MQSKTAPVVYASEDIPLVLIDHSQLRSGADLSRCIETAFGQDGLGMLLVRGIPGFVKARATLLPLAHRFASLPDAVKAGYEDPKSYYNLGWSHGRESVAGKPDYGKGSFYANPVWDTPFADQAWIVEKYPQFCSPNIWPRDVLPELEPAFKEFSRLIIGAGQLLARHCDEYVARLCPEYPRDHLQNVLTRSRMPKARLLHFFPADSLPDPGAPSGSESDYDSWCGWHNDFGSLTGLCSAMYLNANGEEVANPDPTAGLYLKSRSGEVVQARIPADCLAFQIGESQQIHSGGLLQATPHCVRAGDRTLAANRGVSRETFGLFLQPEFDWPMSVPSGRTPADASRGSSRASLPPGVTPLASRWDPAQTFGDFSNATLGAYHPAA